MSDGNDVVICAAALRFLGSEIWLTRAHNLLFETSSSNDWFVTLSGYKIEDKNAMKLLSRYCENLCKLKLSITSSTVRQKEVVELRLSGEGIPDHSNCKYTGDPKDNLELAKNSAAFKACKELYFKDNMAEIYKELIVPDKNVWDIAGQLYVDNGKKKSADPQTAGTRKQRQQYKIEYPDKLSSAMPRVGALSFLHKVEMSFNFDRFTGFSQIQSNFSQTGSGYGILLTKILPTLCSSSLYVSFGTATINFNAIPIQFTLKSENDLEQLKNFHQMLFDDIIASSTKNCLATDYSNKNSSFLIVPYKNNSEIDWDLVRNFQKVPGDHLEETVFVDSQRYFNRVIRYHNGGTTKPIYVVTNIRPDINCLRQHPGRVYQNHGDYYSKKHGIHLKHKTIPWLQVYDPIKLKPALKKNMETAKKKHLGEIVLPPELCQILNFPGCLWLKTQLLPYVLHRLHYLLLAEELRIKICKFIEIDADNYTPDKPLTLVKGNSSVEIPKSCKTHSNEAESYKNLFRNFAGSKSELQYLENFFPSTSAVNGSNFKQTKGSISILEINQPKSPDQCDLVYAITAAGANDVFEMERLEILGDSFLKFVMSINLISKFPERNEGYLTSFKSEIVSNRNLCHFAAKYRLAGMINAITFDSEKNFLPPLQNVPAAIAKAVIDTQVCPGVLEKLALTETEKRTGKCSDLSFTKFIQHIPDACNNQESPYEQLLGWQSVSDKTCADCFEAILGACLKTIGIEKSVKLMLLFEIFPINEHLLAQSLIFPKLNSSISAWDIDQMLIKPEAIEKILKYTFKNRGYLLQATSHPSFTSNKLTPNYQQAEFVGDVVLDFLTTCFIYEQYEEMTPGDLTDLRSALVNNGTLACLSVKYGFHKHLIIAADAEKLTACLNAFENFQISVNHQITDRVRLSNQNVNGVMTLMGEHIDAPKFLGDVFESIVGAVFLDSGNSLNTTWSVLYPLLAPEIDRLKNSPPKPDLRLLYEVKGANPMFSKASVKEDKVIISCSFTCEGQSHKVFGTGANTDSAKIASSKAALKILKG